MMSNSIGRNSPATGDANLTRNIAAVPEHLPFDFCSVAMSEFPPGFNLLARTDWHD